MTKKRKFNWVLVFWAIFGIGATIFTHFQMIPMETLLQNIIMRVGITIICTCFWLLGAGFFAITDLDNWNL